MLFWQPLEPDIINTKQAYLVENWFSFCNSFTLFRMQFSEMCSLTYLLTNVYQSEIVKYIRTLIHRRENEDYILQSDSESTISWSTWSLQAKERLHCLHTVDLNTGNSPEALRRQTPSSHHSIPKEIMGKWKPYLIRMTIITV